MLWPFIIALVVVVVCVGLILRLEARLRRERRRTKQLDADLARLENQLNQAKRMEAVGILAGSIVHNLNNLLAVILGHARMAMHDLPTDTKAQDELERVIKAGHMASDLVQEISDFFRQADQARKPTDLTPLVRDTLKLLRDILPSTIQIDEDLAPDCGPVMATATGIQQVLMNLCSNSVGAFTGDHGRIQVTLRQERIEGWRRAVPQDLGPGSYVKLTFTDNGRGMEQETLNRIFDSYFSGTENGSKMGIGLNTVYRILENHDGVTIPQSTPGRGTSFDIYFPLIAWRVPSPAQSELNGRRRSAGAVYTAPSLIGLGPAANDLVLQGAATIGEAPDQPRATVLLVDDEEMVANVVSRGLQRLGFRVITHIDSRQALADFMQTPEVFDVVVTDQIMPHMSGVLLTRKIHGIRADIPVILVTGFRDSFNEQQAREAGVQEFVLKPTSHRDLADLIDRTLLRSMQGRG